MATNANDGNDDDGFAVQYNQSGKESQVMNHDDKPLESDEGSDDDGDDSDDFHIVGVKRKIVDVFGSEDSEDEVSGNESDEESSDDDEDEEEEEEADEGVGREEEIDLDIDLNDEEDDTLNNSDQCPVCLMSLSGQQLGTPSNCQHVFCLACITEWSKNSNTCPVDRKDFNEILVHSTKKGPILERVPVEDRRVSDRVWEQELTYCEVCNQCNREASMLLCDGCDKGYHLDCLTPRLYTVPAGQWYCTSCIAIRRNEPMDDEDDSMSDMIPGTARRTRGTSRNSSITRRDGETARTAATQRRQSSATRGRGRGRGRETGSRGVGRPRSTSARRGTGSSSKRGRPVKRKSSKRGRSASTTGRPKRKKPRKTKGRKGKVRATRKKTSKRKKNEDPFRNPFDVASYRGRTPKERLSNSLRASASSTDVGRGLGMSSGLSMFGDNYLNAFEDEVEAPEVQATQSSANSSNPDLLGSILDDSENLHDRNASVSRDGRVISSRDQNSPSKNSTSNTSRDGDDMLTSRDDDVTNEQIRDEEWSLDNKKYTESSEHLKVPRGQLKHIKQERESLHVSQSNAPLGAKEFRNMDTERTENYSLVVRNVYEDNIITDGRISAESSRIQSMSPSDERCEISSKSSVDERRRKKVNHLVPRRTRWEKPRQRSMVDSAQPEFVQKTERNYDFETSNSATRPVTSYEHTPLTRTNHSDPTVLTNRNNSTVLTNRNDPTVLTNRNAPIFASNLIKSEQCFANTEYLSFKSESTNSFPREHLKPKISPYGMRYVQSTHRHMGTSGDSEDYMHRDKNEKTNYLRTEKVNEKSYISRFERRSPVPEKRPSLQNITVPGRPRTPTELSARLSSTSGRLSSASHRPVLPSLPVAPSSEASYLPSLNPIQLKPLKPVAKQQARPKLKILSTSELPKGIHDNVSSGVQQSHSDSIPRDTQIRTNQNLAIIQMLKSKTSTLKAEVVREYMAGEPGPRVAEGDGAGLKPLPGTRQSWKAQNNGRYEGEREAANRPKLSSLLGVPRSSSLPVAVVRPSTSFSSLSESTGYNKTSVESSEREENRRKGIARLQLISKIKDAVRSALQPFYDHMEISKEEFKEIFTRAVNKVKDSTHGVFNRDRIASLVKKYVKKYKGLRLKTPNQDYDA